MDSGKNRMQIVRGQSLQSCLTLCEPMDCSPPDSSVHEIFPARMNPRRLNPRLLCLLLAGGFFTAEPPGKSPVCIHKVLFWKYFSFKGIPRKGLKLMSQYQVNTLKFMPHLKSPAEKLHSFSHGVDNGDLKLSSVAFIQQGSKSFPPETGEWGTHRFFEVKQLQNQRKLFKGTSQITALLSEREMRSGKKTPLFSQPLEL